MTRPAGTPLPGNRWDLLDGRWPADLPTVSVIVPHYRQQAELDRTLAALGRQTYPRELLEIVVADDGSPTAPEVPAGVTVVRQDDLGFRLSAARNLGARASRGEILCFLDADTAPEPHYVERLTRLVALSSDAVTVGRRRHADLAGVPVATPIEEAGPEHELAEPTWLRESYERSRDLLDADDRSYRFAIGAVIACSRMLFDEVGGFDESFRDYGGEDWEWAHRAWVGGCVLAHVPDAVAWHDGPEWSGRQADDGERRRAKNAETRVLAARIPVAGSRPRALLMGDPDVVVRIEAEGSPTQLFVTVDSLLATLPQARVVVAEELLPLFGADPRVSGAEERDARPRVTITVHHPVRLARTNELAAVVDAVGIGELGAIRLDGADGAVLLAVESRRARARHDRWGVDDLFTVRHDRVGWVAPLTDEPRLASYLGGWDER